MATGPPPRTSWPCNVSGANSGLSSRPPSDDGAAVRPFGDGEVARQLTRLDIRIFSVFVLIVLALMAPGAWQAISPTSAQDLEDAVSTLQSEVREASTVVASRDRVTAMYYRAHLEDLGDSATQTAGVLTHKPAEPEVRVRNAQVVALLKTFADASADAALTHDDAAGRERSLATLQQLGAQLVTLESGP